MAESSIAKGTAWEPHIVRFVEKLKEVYDIHHIVDVGANFGYHTLFFSRIVGEGGMVFAFEPQVQNYDLLQKNVHDNSLTNVTTFNNACADTEDVVYMPLFELPLTAPTNMGDITPNVLCHNVIAYTHPVKSVRLDDVGLPKIDMVKIDVQGWEIHVLHGFRKKLQEDKPILIVEFEHFQMSKLGNTCKDLADILRKHGYHIFYLEYTYPSDHVCVHNDHLPDFCVKFRDHIHDHSENNAINQNVSLGVNQKICM